MAVYLTLIFLGVVGWCWLRWRLSPRNRVANFEGQGRQYAVNIVGESHYLANLKRIAGLGEVRHACTASLVIEHGNPHDKNAVAVYIDGLQVGYLRRQYAKHFRAQLAQLNATEGQCPALIIGGGRNRKNLGVWLDLPEA